MVRKEGKEIASQRPARKYIKSSKRSEKDLTRIAEVKIILVWDLPKAHPKIKIHMQKVSLKGDPRKYWLEREEVMPGKKGRQQQMC